MLFTRIEPEIELTPVIECYWTVENEDSTPVQQKILPDGFTEIIFHFGNPYRIRLAENWQIQGKSLLAGQIRRYFFLENTGTASILGIKLKPTALTHLFDLHMHLFTDRVINLDEIPGLQLIALEKNIRFAESHDERIHLINNHFRQAAAFKNYKPAGIDAAIQLAREKNGMVAIRELREAAGVGERQLENIFQKYIGLSPKFFTRIIRFNYIFQLAEQKKDNWTGLAYEAAYYDQSHFIRNFKSFTGESPAAYSFDEKNMANFFLQKK